MNNDTPFPRWLSLLISSFICGCVYFGLRLPNDYTTIIMLVPVFLFFYFGCRGKIFS